MANRQNSRPASSLRRRAAKIVRRLAKEYPEASCALNFRTPLELLIATILSAQCTDRRVNMVTSTLFRKYRSARAYAQSNLAELEQDIRTTGFFRNKAKSIRECCRLLDQRHGGEVPASIDELVKLRGIGRKTANVVLGTAMGLATGVVVDTHVRRLATRMGLTRQKDPEKIEQDFITLLPKRAWIDFSHRMIHHGRQVCSARKPACDACALDEVCPKIGVSRS